MIPERRFNKNAAIDCEIATRLHWVGTYLETGNAGLVCARRGLSRRMLRKWLSRQRGAGEQGLRIQTERGSDFFAEAACWLLPGLSPSN